MKIFNRISSLIAARNGANPEWKSKHDFELHRILSDGPSGSGIDKGIRLDNEKSKPNRFVLVLDFHHMDENGYYAGWTEHTAVIQASMLYGFEIRITGVNRNDIKDYLIEVLHHWLNSEMEEVR